MKTRRSILANLIAIPFLGTKTSKLPKVLREYRSYEDATLAPQLGSVHPECDLVLADIQIKPLLNRDENNVTYPSGCFLADLVYISL